jgi:4-amino-4-deoxy-L-arabinose transferase-like glycosyltransferase
MTRRALWLVLVVALFCCPLFVGLGNPDLQNDEAIYSFAVVRILETGDWLMPKSSPQEDEPFLEKPPLKFWIVAAPIRLGLLPLDERSLRIWDAAFGGAAFLYVFGLGRLLAGPVCGILSVLVLFIYPPLLFQHGLRSNDMEAALLLSYCGGVYHYLRWAALAGDRRRSRHAVAVGLYFVLGFMTKFVAALFLPLVLGAGALLLGAHRRRLVQDRRLWGVVAAMVVALCVPWFAYATWRYGALFWRIIVGRHVVTRFTAYLDPRHLEPWSFYWTSLYASFADSGSALLVIAGLVALAVDALRRRSAEATLFSLWFWLPVVAISAGTSKIIHYVYPFVPPLALGAGYLVVVASRALAAALDRPLDRLDQRSGRWLPRLTAWTRRPATRMVLLAIAASAAAAMIGTSAYGSIRLHVGRTTLFQNSGLVRPGVVAVALVVLAGTTRQASRLVVPLLVAALLLPAYGDILERTGTGEHPLRSMRDCLVRLAHPSGDDPRPALYADVPIPATPHPVYYYLRALQPWAWWKVTKDHGSFAPFLDDPRQLRPVLVSEESYDGLMRDVRADPAAKPPLATTKVAGVVLLLPGPYAACRPVDQGIVPD